jgi:hypothetical protein
VMLDQALGDHPALGQTLEASGTDHPVAERQAL